METLVNRVIEQGLPPYLLQEIDLLVFPRRVGEDRYVGEVIELVDEVTYRNLDRDAERCGAVRKGDATVYWNAVCWREQDGDFAFAGALADDTDVPASSFERLAEQTDQSVADIQATFERRHRYVRYLVQEGITDADELFALLADLQTDEAATVERLHQQRTDQRSGRVEGADGD